MCLCISVFVVIFYQTHSYLVQVASWMSSENGPPVIKWAPGSLMFVTGSSELSFWIPDLSKLGAYVGRK